MPLPFKPLASIRFWLAYTERAKNLRRCQPVLQWLRECFNVDRHPVVPRDVRAAAEHRRGALGFRHAEQFGERQQDVIERRGRHIARDRFSISVKLVDPGARRRPCQIALKQEPGR